MKTYGRLLGLCGALALGACAGTVSARGEAALGDLPFTDEFFIEECQFVTTGRNMFWSLEPGYQLYLAGEEDKTFGELTITVTEQTRNFQLDFNGRRRLIKTRVVIEEHRVDGKIVEISKNYYARCRATNDVFYFGEDVCNYENGVCVNTNGSWLAGVNGATPGIIMPGRFLLGARYFQEMAPGVALDRAEHVEMNVKIDTPAGQFDDCVFVSESSAVDPSAMSEKYYAPGVGLVQDGALILVTYGFKDDDNNN